MRKAIMVAIFAISGLMAGAAAQAQDDDLPVYGREMMTGQEMQDLRRQLRDAESYEECEQLRMEHFEKMQERATERGFTLPEEPLGPGPCERIQRFGKGRQPS